MCSSKARYLIFFQYFGTKYSGVMKAPIHQNVLGVQNYLEDALRKLRPVNEIAVFISSRTDSGVHALQNSAHVEIQRKEGNMPFSEQVLVDALNYHLQSEPISIIKAFRVPDTFHARYCALSRTYLYRFVTGVTHHSQIPVFERNLCWALPTQHFSTEAVQDAAQLLKGTHDFSTFRSLNSETPFRSPVKTLQEVTVAPVESSFSRHYCHQHMQYWELTFQSKSFLYKQVRRMTGALVAVGQGRLTPKQLQDLLDVRNSLAFPQNMIAPPDGLFLKEVKYENFRN
ncbi:tRNA pseudouridine synthase-like 1 isoform X1 [Erpetoichthys calabaricus]|uniref:tRNA pseudouridine synthase-like 1 isoform X1 n=1 Tax=Erpetoichthys calabaricus TaxID=27687 RepID=UPI00223495D4|nr:tRNA pseudouridine synthase-like 1 isoform X1 [Erpetoichthys calabaricus]